MSSNIEIVLPITSICLTVFGNNEKLRYSIDKTVKGLDKQDIIDKGQKMTGGILDLSMLSKVMLWISSALFVVFCILFGFICS